MARIPNKAAYYRLWRAGVLGNRPLAWADAEALAKSGYSAPVVVRSATVVGFKTIYGMPVEEALALAKRVPGLTFNQCLPDEKIVLQGEAMRGERGLELTYAFDPYPMKVALAKGGRTACGLFAKMLLDHYLWPASRDDLDALWDLYPDAVIEFTAYSIAIGDQPHRNTLLWECRDY